MTQPESKMVKAETAFIQSFESLTAYLNSMDHRIVSVQNETRFINSTEALISALTQNIMKGFPGE